MFRHVSSDFIPLAVSLFQETISLFEQNRLGKFASGKLVSPVGRVGTLHSFGCVRVWTYPHGMAGKGGKSPSGAGTALSLSRAVWAALGAGSTCDWMHRLAGQALLPPRPVLLEPRELQATCRNTSEAFRGQGAGGDARVEAPFSMRFAPAISHVFKKTLGNKGCAGKLKACLSQTAALQIPKYSQCGFPARTRTPPHSRLPCPACT